jgi:hypothetical protein
LVQLEWNAQILGKVVEGAQGQHPEWDIVVHAYRGRRVDGPVTTPGYEQIAAIANGLLHGAAELLSTPCHRDSRLPSGFSKDLLQLLGFGGAVPGAGRVIEDHGDPTHQVDRRRRRR